MGAGERGGQGVELLAQRGQRGRAMRRRLGGDGHAQLALRDFQAGGRLEGGVKQRAAFLVGPGIVILEHLQQLRLDLVSRHLDRVGDELLLRLQHLPVAGRDPRGDLLALSEQLLDLGLGLMKLLAEFRVRDLESPHGRSRSLWRWLRLVFPVRSRAA